MSRTQLAELSRQSQVPGLCAGAPAALAVRVGCLGATSPPNSPRNWGSNFSGLWQRQEGGLFRLVMCSTWGFGLGAGVRGLLAFFGYLESPQAGNPRSLQRRLRAGSAGHRATVFVLGKSAEALDWPGWCWFSEAPPV